MQETAMSQNLTCFAYQTPPYGESVTENSSARSSPKNNVFNELLVDKLAILLRRQTIRYNIGKSKQKSKEIRDFVKELLKRSQCNRKTALLAAVYFEKIYRVVGELPEFARCARRIYLCCLMLSHKFLHDRALSLSVWRLISGLKPRDLSFMERWCLGRLDYHLYVKDSELRALESKLMQLSNLK